MAVVLAQFPLPPPVVRRPTAAALQDRHQIGGGQERVDWLLPPPRLARWPATAVVAHFLLPQPPAVRPPASAVWRDKDEVVWERRSGELQPLPRPAVGQPATVA